MPPSPFKRGTLLRSGTATSGALVHHGDLEVGQRVDLLLELDDEYEPRTLDGKRLHESDGRPANRVANAHAKEGAVLRLVDAGRATCVASIGERHFLYNEPRDVVQVPEALRGQWMGTVARAADDSWSVVELARLDANALPEGDGLFLARDAVMHGARQSLYEADAYHGIPRGRAVAEGAAAMLTALVDKLPGEPEVRVLRGRFHVLLGSWAAAERDLRAGIAAADDADVRDLLAESIAAQGRLDEALAEAKLLPDSHADRVGEIHLARKAASEACLAFERCIRAAATPFRVERSHLARGVLELQAGRPERALADFDACVASFDDAMRTVGQGANDDRGRRRSRALDAALRRGDCLVALGRTSEAIAAWKALPDSALAKERITETERKRALTMPRRPPTRASED